MKITNELIVKYLRDALSTKDDTLLELEKYAKVENVPIIEPEVARCLEMIVRMKRPKNILEIGTAIGYSALVMKKAYQKAKITTIEIDENKFWFAKKSVEKAGFSSSDIHILYGDAINIIPLLNEKFDLIFMDAAKGQYLNFFELILPLLKREGVIIIDNILYQGMVCDKEYYNKRHRKITIVKRLRELIGIITDQDVFDTSILPIDDGLAITMKK